MKLKYLIVFCPILVGCDGDGIKDKNLDETMRREALCVVASEQAVEILLTRPSTALKPSSKYSFTPVNSAFSLGFALYLARLSEFQQPVKGSNYTMRLSVIVGMGLKLVEFDLIERKSLMIS